MNALYRESSWESGARPLCACCYCSSHTRVVATTCSTTIAPRTDWRRLRRWMLAATAVLFAIGVLAALPAAVALHQLATRERVALSRAVAAQRTRGPQRVSATPTPPRPVAMPVPSFQPPPPRGVGITGGELCQITTLAAFGGETHNPMTLLDRAQFLRRQGCSWRVLPVRRLTREFAGTEGPSGFVEAFTSGGTTVRGARLAAPGREFRDAGFFQGDVITAINGYRVGDEVGAGSIGTTAPTVASSLVVEVLRNGEHVVLDLFAVPATAGRRDASNSDRSLSRLSRNARAPSALPPRQAILPRSGGVASMTRKRSYGRGVLTRADSIGDDAATSRPPVPAYSKGSPGTGEKCVTL